MTSTAPPRGGSWLIQDVAPAAVFTPERLTEEHRLVARTANDFVDQEVLPALDRLEQKDWALTRDLLKRCAGLGLLGTDVPASLGGLELDAVTNLIVAESVGRCASFSATFGAQTGLTLTPLLYFGSEDQKRRYVPRLVEADLVGAYALSESGSGSDALGARTSARRLPDGSFSLNGEKMWITNGGFADIFIVFARVFGDGASPGDTGQFSAFIVERGFPGVTTGSEEHKMGLHGSSTTPVILQDARIPAENVLGEIGRGHVIAFNVLNFGRLKLGAMCSGGARRVIGEAAKYARERRQFGKPIASFGAIRHKLAEMAVREYAVEAMLYRTAGLIDAAAVNASGSSRAGVLEEFAVEASILKVAGSEMLDFVVDENVQVHGGNGFVRDYPAERHYRDARVNRIFEGTNEINRLLIPTLLARRAAKRALPIGDAAGSLQPEVQEGGSLEPGGRAPLERARATVAGLKKTALLVLGRAIETFGAKLGEAQDVLLQTADIVIAAYAAESVALRAAAAGQELHDAAAILAVQGAARQAQSAAIDALGAMLTGTELERHVEAVTRLTAVRPVNVIALRGQLADAVTERRVYPF